MPGTVRGGKSAAITNKERYGKDFYKTIGAVGGKLGKTGGFASDTVGADGLTGKERARIAGAKGGTISRRKKTETKCKVVGCDRLARSNGLCEMHYQRFRRGNEE